MNGQTGSRSTGPFASRRRPISRRRFLRGSAVAMALPVLESMAAPFARASVAGVPRRMFCICNNLGVLPRPFFPEDVGLDYTPSPYLKLLQEHRADFTVLSGVSHPNVDGGHPSDISFLTAAPHPASSSFRNSISLDQLVAERIGNLTRFPSLTLAVNGGRGPAQYMAKVQVMYDLARLAFETDSTRAITLMLNSVGTPVVQIAGATITDSYHNLSHHGMAEEKLSQLKTIDEWHMKLLAELLKGLKSVREEGATLLGRTMVLYGSNLGDANAHSTTNLPTLLAGGGFRHGQHLAFDRGRNYPLPNLFVSMLQRMGIEETGFGPSTGTMRGLEMH